ncbi:putative ATP-grasp-modified RiPP [Streptomyces sp. NBRC 109706]|uniref:putative ATP-grasp-modified RiPP n=1 Tax=Streptomyces sp. NBRC 109706 TaxID=1550035 RepID=UPI00099C79A7|nr:putative ATP-grasp-modified RiPP [Streptomyces sp. NBRC 109706]
MWWTRRHTGGTVPDKRSPQETASVTPWGVRRLVPLRNGEGPTSRYEGIDPATQTGRWVDLGGVSSPADLGKHGTSVNTYPPTQVSKDGRIDADSGHDAQQDEGQH